VRILLDNGGRKILDLIEKFSYYIEKGESDGIR
jgi:hypothetical protein